jgi:hypothetical protein
VIIIMPPFSIDQQGSLPEVARVVGSIKGVLSQQVSCGMNQPDTMSEQKYTDKYATNQK